MKEIHLEARGDTSCESKDHLEFMYLDHNISVSDFGERFKCHQFHPHCILHCIISDGYQL